MSKNIKPPFRADQVGSLLRPAELHEARAKFKRGELPRDALTAIEDKCIREAVARQEAVGIQAVTDGEFRRDWWHVDFLAGFGGVETKPDPGVAAFQGIKVEDMPPIMFVAQKLRRTKPVFVDHFKFLKSVTKNTPKMTIPAPAMLHHRGGRNSVSKEAYPDMAEFWDDVGRAYQEEIRDLVAAGCTYLQIDDTSYSMLCDEKFRAMTVTRGDNPSELVHTYAAAINKVLTGRPAGLNVTMHTCRGNFMSSWVASGGYDTVAEAVFNEVKVDGFFLEYDSDRAGGFEPLRFMPKDKKVVLGLVTSKSPVLESKDLLKRRIDEAAKYVPLENLCLSPQCGFASTHHGNKLTAEDQWKKLRLIVEVAEEVWG